MERTLSDFDQSSITQSQIINTNFVKDAISQRARLAEIFHWQILTFANFKLIFVIA